MGMERDVELLLTERMAAIEERITHLAREVARGFKQQAEALDEITVQVKQTNGRVNALERENEVRAAVRKAAESAGVATSAVITIGHLKWWIAIAMGSGSFAVGVTLWILRTAGKL